MSGGFGPLSSFASGDDPSGLSPELRTWLQSQNATATAIPPEVDGALAQRGLPSMSSVLNGMVNGAMGDASTVGGFGSRVGSMLGDMLGRTGDLISKFRDGSISPSEFLGAAADRARDAAVSTVTAPQRAYSGDLQIWDPSTGHTTEEAQNAASGLAGLAMTGSLPFKAPAGALRSFGGGQSLDDLLASMDSAISAAKPTLEPPAPGPRRLDPNAKSWDVYHGATPGQDFQRFDPALANNPAERGAVFFAPDPETAAAYAGSPKEGAEAGSRVFRATVDPGKTGVFDLSHLAETDPAFNARARELTVRDSSPGYGPIHDDYMDTYRARREQDRDIARQVAEMGFPVGHDPSGNISYGWGHIGAAIERAQAQGLDTAILRNLAEHGGDDQVVALTPNRVRSAYAPDQILYSGGPGGAAAGLPAFAARAASPSTDQKGAPMAAGFGQLPSFADFSADDMAALLQRLQQAPQDPRDTGPQPNTQGQPPEAGGLGGLLSPGLGAPPVAMDERQTQALERAQAGPQDLAALGGSPVDRLLYDRTGMGGGANGFTGSADPYGARNVPLPPARPSDDALAAQPTATGSVSGMNPQRQVAASSTYHHELASNTPPGGRPAAAADLRGQTGDFDPLTGTVISGTPRPVGGQQAPASSFGGAPSAAPQAAAQGGPQQSMMERFAQGLNNPDFSNLMLNIGIGLLTNRGIPQGIGAGLQGYQQSRLGDVKQQLQMYQLQQQVQQQNATRAYLRGKGLPADQVEAATLNPAILSSVQAQMNKDPSQITFGGNTYLVPPGGRPDASNLLGPSGTPLDQEVKKADALASVADAHAKDDIVLQSDGQGGTIAVRKSSLFPDKAATGTAGEGGASGSAGDPNVRTIIPPQPDKKANEGLDKLIGDNITGGYQKAQGAVGTLAAISRQKEALDKGVISGSGADWRTQAQAIGAQLLGIDPSSLNASYSFDAASTQKQAELAKAVSQAGHTTNMDLQLGKTIAGGDRSKTEQALRQIVDAQEQLARDAIDRHNAALDKYAKIAPEAAARTGFFRVDTPEVYRYGQGTPNPVADPGTRMPTSAPAPLDVGGSRQFQGITIKRVR